jgi:MHS family proline/betaine transporter-like MFS transporter
LLSQNSIYSLVIAQFILVILVGTAAGSLMPLLTSLFPSYIRYTGVGIGFNVSMTLFGSTAPLISLYISGSKDNPYPLTIYVMLIACVTLYALNQNDKQHVVQNKFPDYQEVV